jgi:hypothetical protein
MSDFDPSSITTDHAWPLLSFAQPFDYTFIANGLALTLTARWGIWPCQPEQEQYSPSPFLGVCRTFWMYGKTCLGASTVIAYTNNGYPRDTYR